MNDVFMKNLLNDKANTNFWLQIEKTHFFIIHKFTDTTFVKEIADGITDKSIVFDENGNIKTKTKNFINPLTSVDSINTNKTLTYLLSLDGYKNTENLFLNENMKYILTSKENTYYLFYNPIHRKSFKDYYSGIPNDDLSFGTTTGDNLQGIFKDYCESLLDSKVFADPTCQCFFSPQQNINNAYFGKNSVQTQGPIDGQIQNMLYGTKHSHKAVCLAPGCEYTGVDNSSSFLSDFVDNNSDCQQVNELCKDIVQREQAKNTYIYNKCNTSPAQPKYYCNKTTKTCSTTGTGTGYDRIDDCDKNCSSDPPDPPDPPNPKTNNSKINIIVGSSMIGISLLIFTFILVKKLKTKSNNN